MIENFFHVFDVSKISKFYTVNNDIPFILVIDKYRDIIS